MAEFVGIGPMQPRRCGRQPNRANPQADDIIMETYFKLNLTIPVLDQLVMGLDERVDSQYLLVTNTMYLFLAEIERLL